MKLKIKPKRYQKRGVSRAWNRFHGRALIADEMGLGKSAQAMMMFLRGNMDTAIVICPSACKYSWEREVEKVLGAKCQVIEGRKPYKLDEVQFYIINYEILKDWVQPLTELDADLLVVDECQRIKNKKTLSYENTRDIALGGRKQKGVRRRRIPYMLALSGTPLTNRPAELWPTLNLLNPKEFKAFFPFGQNYCKPTRRFGVWEYKGAENLPHLHRTLKRTCMIRRTKEQVLSELPDWSVQTIPLPLGAKDLKDYNKASTEFKRWLTTNGYATHNKEGLSRVTRLKTMAAEMKVPALIQWLESYKQETAAKLVVFGIHRKVLRPLAKYFRSSCVLVDGTVTGRKRDAAIQQFCKDPKCQFMFGQMKAMGVGINGLQEVAQTAMFAELPYDPATVHQAKDRLHRLGQKDSVLIYFALARGTVEEHLSRLLLNKSDNMEVILDGKSGKQTTLFRELFESYK